MNTEIWENGVLRTRWDITSRTVSSWDANGVLIEERPYTAAENASADAMVATEALNAAQKATRERVKLIVTELQAEKDRVQLVIDKTNANITGADTKDVARAAKRIADAAIDLARLLTDV